MLTLDLAPNKYDMFVTKYSGYFYAPAAGDYKFYVSGGHTVAFYISG